MVTHFPGNDPFYPQFKMDRYSTKIEGGASRQEKVALELFGLLYSKLFRSDDFGQMKVATPEATRTLAKSCMEAAAIFCETIDSLKPTIPVPPPKELPVG